MDSHKAAEQVATTVRRKREAFYDAQKRAEEAQRRVEVAGAELRAWEEAYQIISHHSQIFCPMRQAVL